MPQILDQYGKPIDRAVLAEPQTAKLRSLKAEFALHPSRGLTPAKLASILDGAEQGDLQSQSDLFLDMEEKDAHIYAEMSKRKHALLTVGWDITVPEGAGKPEQNAAALAKELIGEIPDFEDVLLDCLDAIGKGYACLEFEWGRAGRYWVPRKLHWRPQSWFTLDQETHTELRLRDNSTAGAPLTPFGWITHVHRAKSGYIARGGLHRVLAWPYLFKNYSVRDLAEFLEIYGLPLRVGTYPSGTGDAEKTTLLNAVVGIGHNAAGIIPQGMAIEFKEAAKGTQEPFEAMMDWCERSESKAILGATLTSEAKPTGLGSNLAEVHNEVRHDLLASDARQLGSTLKRDLLYPILALNSANPEAARALSFLFDTRQPEDLRTYATSIPPLVNVGLQIPARYLREKLRIPEPKDDEAVLTPAAPSPFGSFAAARSRIARAAANAADPDAREAAAVADQVRLAEASGELAGAWREDLGPLVEELVAMAEQTGDIVTFRERLAELARADPSADLVTRLERSAFTAQLMGRTAQPEPGPALAEAIVEAGRANAQAIERALAARPAPQAVNVHPVAAATEKLATAVAQDGRATRESIERATEEIGAAAAQAAQAQSRPPSWLDAIVSTMRELVERVDRALARPSPRVEKTVTAPDGREFKITEKEIQP